MNAYSSGLKDELFWYKLVIRTRIIAFINVEKGIFQLEILQYKESFGLLHQF